jgi:dinuclear metal center YbgI/SA1388 family protein
MVFVRDVLAWVDGYAPFRYAASWDHCGLQVGDPAAEVATLLVALEANSVTLAEAARRGCQCLVAHHPLIFQPVQSVRADEFPGGLVTRAILGGIHVIAAHTNLDAAVDGTNDVLAGLFTLHTVSPLEVDASLEGADRYRGIGRVGMLPCEMSLEQLVREAGRLLNSETVRAVGNPDQRVSRVALCSGSGGSLIDSVLNVGVDVYLTGDVKYHDAQRAIEGGLAVVDIGHFASERLIVPPLARYLRTRVAQVSTSVHVLEAGNETDPFWHGPRIL